MSRCKGCEKKTDVLFLVQRQPYCAECVPFAEMLEGKGFSPGPFHDTLLGNLLKDPDREEVLRE